MAKRLLNNWGKDKEKSDSKPAAKEEPKVDMASERMEFLADKAGIKDLGAFKKLVRACMEDCSKEGDKGDDK